MKVPHISASSVKTWNSCKLQFYADKILKVPRREEHPMTRVGSAVHLAFEKGTKEKEAIGNLAFACNKYNLEDKDLIDMATDLSKTCEEWGWWDGIDDLDHCIPEYEFLLDIGLGVFVKGFIDRLDIQGDMATILDIKTQAKKFTNAELKKNLQADIYNLATRMEHPRITGPIRVEFWVLKHEIQAVTKTKEDALRTREYLRGVGREILDWDDDLQPHGTQGYYCRWCNFAEECPELKKN